MNKNTPITIYLDCTRLLGNSLSVRPSGIERVDMNYLHAIIADRDFYPLGFIEAVLVGGKTNGFFEISNETTRQWIATCYKKWIEDGLSDDVYLTSIQTILNNVKLEVRNAVFEFSATQQVDNKILQRTGQNKVAPKYLNCTFINIPLGLQHAELMSSLNIETHYHVHDLIPIKYPEYIRNNAIPKEHLNRLYGAAKNKSKMIVMSKHVRNDIDITLEQLGVTSPEMIIINPGVEDVFIASSKYNAAVFSPVPKFTIISTIEPRKNHVLLLNIWRELIETYGERAPELHIIGRRGWDNDSTFHLLDKSPALKTKVKEHNSLSEEEIVGVLMESRVTLFPSFDEGWGLPIVESLSHGIPVICSDIPVNRECSQGYATFISPIDGIAWKNEIVKIASESQSDWASRVHTVKQFVPVRWSDSTKKMVSYLKSGS